MLECLGSFCASVGVTSWHRYAMEAGSVCCDGEAAGQGVVGGTHRLAWRELLMKQGKLDIEEFGETLSQHSVLRQTSQASTSSPELLACIRVELGSSSM